MLSDRGYKLSDSLSVLTVGAKLGLSIIHVLPLQRLDGKKLGRNDPKTLMMSFCPFCGTKLEGGAE